MKKLINIDTGEGRKITPPQEARLKLAIHNGLVSIDLGESLDIDGDYCLHDDEYTDAVKVLGPEN